MYLILIVTSGCIRCTAILGLFLSDARAPYTLGNAVIELAHVK
jgi:hypothetical protein